MHICIVYVGMYVVVGWVGFQGNYVNCECCNCERTYIFFISV